MSISNKTTIGSSFNQPLSGYFKDNIAKEITPAFLRLFVDALLQSYPNLADDLQKKTTASGTNTYAASGGLTAYTDGFMCLIKFTNASTGASTLNIATLGAKKLYKDPTTQVGNGDIPANSILLLVYDSSLDSAAGGFLRIGGVSSGGVPDATSSTKGIAKLYPSTSLGTNTDGAPDQNAVKAYVDAGDALKLDKLIVTNRQTASYGLVLADATKLVEMNVAGANNITVPLNSSQAFSVGTQILLTQYGAGQTSIVATGGVSIRSAGGKLKLTGQYSIATLIKIATDEWYLSGDITT